MPNKKLKLLTEEEFKKVCQAARDHYINDLGWPKYDGRAVDAALEGACGGDGDNTYFFHRATCYVDNDTAREQIRMARYCKGWSEKKILGKFRDEFRPDSPIIKWNNPDLQTTKGE